MERDRCYYETVRNLPESVVYTSKIAALIPSKISDNDGENDFVFATPRCVNKPSRIAPLPLTPFTESLPSKSTKGISSFRKGKILKTCSYIIKKGARKNCKCEGKIKRLGYQYCSKHIGREQLFLNQTNTCGTKNFEISSPKTKSFGTQTVSKIFKTCGTQTDPINQIGAIKYRRKHLIPNRHYRLESYFDKFAIISFTEYSGRMTIFRLYLPNDIPRKNIYENWYLTVPEKNGDLQWIQK